MPMEERYSGVAMYLSPKTTKCLMFYTSITSRILYVRFKCKPVNTCVNSGSEYSYEILKITILNGYIPAT